MSDTKKLCTSCGHPNKLGARYCSSCAHPFGTPVVSSDQVVLAATSQEFPFPWGELIEIILAGNLTFVCLFSGILVGFGLGLFGILATLMLIGHFRDRLGI